MRGKIQTILESLKAAGTAVMAVWNKRCEELIKSFFQPSPPDHQPVIFNLQPSALNLSAGGGPAGQFGGRLSVLSLQPFNTQPNNPGYIPTVIKTSLDMPPLWGRLVRLWPEGAELTSKFEIKKSRMAALCFELGGNDYEDIRALVTEAAKDCNGYFVYKLAFKDPGQIKAVSDEILKAVDRKIR